MRKADKAAKEDKGDIVRRDHSICHWFLLTLDSQAEAFTFTRARPCQSGVLNPAQHVE